MMHIGAVIIAAGCGDAPMLPAGGISVAQRMVAAFQKAGVDLIALITSPEDKKLEKQLAQPGLVFLHNKGGPSGSGSLLTQKGQELLDAYVQFESAVRESMEKLYDAYLRDVL